MRCLECPRIAGAQLRAARANRDFGTDEKHIRTKIAVMDKTKDALGLLLFKIDDPRGRFLVRAKA